MWGRESCAGDVSGLPPACSGDHVLLGMELDRGISSSRAVCPFIVHVVAYPLGWPDLNYQPQLGDSRAQQPRALLSVSECDCPGKVQLTSAVRTH